MKNPLKRSASFLLAFLLSLSLVLPAFADETTGTYEEIDTYVLHHNVEGDDYDGPNLQYFSPYVTDYAYDGYPSYIQSNIFSLYNTVTKEVVPTYCTDIKVGALPDHRYRRLNLEDSTYAASAAGLLRAIVRNGFYLVADPDESMDDHALRVATKLQELGAAAGVTDLTIGEAISGTQTAIWQAAHGSRLEFTDFVRTIYTTKLPSVTKYYDLCNEERENGHIDYTVSTYGKVTVDADCDALLNSRIRAVYDYLLSLKPIEATAKAVSASSFVKLQDPVPTANEDGTYDISVTTTVDVDMVEGDSLVLSAVLDTTHFASAALSDGRQELTLTIENVPAELASNNVMLAIDGLQTVSDVFLYDAYGDRETAQSMIGADDSQLPVHASVLAMTDRVLNFHKTAPIATGSYYPLEGITFDIFLAATMDDYLSGAVTLPEPEDYAHADMSDLTVITDENGYATMNFTQHGMPDGVYLVVEREHPAIKAPVAPFYVTIPATKIDGSGQEYEVNVRAKNELKGNVNIEKDVISLGNDTATVDSYASHTWIIGTSIPDDLSGGKSFVISDTLDHRLDYLGNVKVNLETEDGETIVSTLTADTDYTLAVSDVDSLAEGFPSDSFALELTQTGMAAIADSIGENSFGDYMLRVYFDAQINGNAEMGTQIPNQATLRYINSVNFEFNIKSDKPVVATGAVNLLKVDADNHETLLPGAQFRVYRNATMEEVAAGGDELTLLEGVSATVVPVSFFDHAEMAGQKVTVATTNENGKVGIYGLAYGNYYLLETKAPEGYNLSNKAVEFVVDGSSHEEEKTLTIENTGGTILPATGGSGTMMYTIIGVSLICISFFVFLSLKKRSTT